jgi:hypothetical protein
MAGAARKIPFDEFASDIESYFDRVVRQNEPIMVERGIGEIAILQPVHARRRRKPKRSAADHEAFLSSFGSWSDFDVDTFLKDVYEGRTLSTRPTVDL